MVKDAELRRRLFGHVAIMHSANWVLMLITSGRMEKTSSLNFIFQGTVSSCNVFSICANICPEVHSERGVLKDFFRLILFLLLLLNLGQLETSYVFKQTFVDSLLSKLVLIICIAAGS